MKRRWNVSIWAGFLIVVAALLTYLPVFVRIPLTRDFPWPTLLLFGAGLALIGVGLKRAYGEPGLYRGRIAGGILAVLAIGLVAFFCYGVFYAARQLPPSVGAPAVGQQAPDFTLPDKDGHLVTLSKLLDPGAGKTHGAVLVFYRGFW